MRRLNDETLKEIITLIINLNCCMTSKVVRSNARVLQGMADVVETRLSAENREKVQSVVQFYTDRKISQFETARNLIRSMNSTKAKERNKAIAKIDALADRAPLNTRMAQNRKHEYRISYYIYKKIDPSERRYDFVDEDGVFHRTMMANLTQASVKMSDGEIPEKVIGNFLMKNRLNNATTETRKSRKTKTSSNIHDSALFKTVFKILDTDKNFKGMDAPLRDYIRAFKILSIDKMETSRRRKRNPLDENLREGNLVSIYNNYIETELDIADTFKEAIAKKNCYEGECWINALVDYYGDTLMSNKRKERLRLTREKVIDLIGKTEEEFKQKGASVNDMKKVFNEFNIPFRIYDFFGNLLDYKDLSSRRVRCFYAMVKNKHIYVLNNNLNSLCQFKNQGSKEWTVKASTDFHISKDKEAPACKMISHIDELVHLNEAPEYKLIHATDDLIKVFNDLNNAGYEPRIKYVAGRISELLMRFNKINYRIVSHNMLPDYLDESITMDSEITFNKVNDAMFKFQNDLFKANHKSYYNEMDLQILQECRTTAPHGKLPLYKTLRHRQLNVTHITEIDINKSYQSDLQDLTRIPVFHQLDEWKTYKGEKIHNLTLYLVKADKVNLFFQKPYCLVYGRFLKHLQDSSGITIIYYKKTFLYI